jgi:hypothetical protein
MLALGLLLGGTVTVGMAATMLHVGPMSPNVAPKATASVAVTMAAPAAKTAPAANAPGVVRQGAGDEPAAHDALAEIEATPLPMHTTALLTANDGVTEPAAVGAPTPPAVHGAHARPAARRLDSSSSLSLEASLITEARAALVNGDPLTALRKARVARALPARQLVPEELTVEAQALRALGRDSEASNVDQALRAQYPESALAR